jgi:hypothetical protein
MSASTYNVTLKATDGISSTFAKVGHSGDQMSQQLVKDLQQVERSSQTMGRSVTQAAATSEAGFRRFNTAGIALGASIGTLGGILSEFSRSSEAAAQIHRQLEQAIQNTGHAYDEYASQIEKAGAAAVQLGYDDEAAFQALQVLTENTGSAQVALDQLGLAEDLAAAKGMSLESAATLISRVYSGNVGILKRYGIVVAEGATATEALAQVQAQVAGQAEAHATSLARWHEELSNIADAVGGAMGQFAPFIAMLPGLSVGFSSVTGILGGLTGAMKEAGAGAALLDLALGPAGLVVGIGAAVAGFYLLEQHLGGTYSDSVNTAEQATAKLVDAINQLAGAGDKNALILAEWRANMVSFGSETQDLGTFIDKTTQSIAILQEQQKKPGVDNQAQIDQLQEQLTRMKDLEQQYGSTSAAAEEYAATENALVAITEHHGPAEQEVLQQAQALEDQLVAGTITFKQYEDAIIALSGNMGQLDQAALQAESGVNKLADAATNHGGAISAEHAALMTFNNDLRSQESIMGGIIEATNRWTGEVQAQTMALDAATRAQQLNRQTMSQFQGMNAQANDINNLIALNKELAQSRMEAGSQVAFAGMNIQADDLNNLIAYNAALHENESAMDRVARGSSSAAVQMRAFNDIQAGIIAQEQPLTQIASEYGGQLNAIAAAQDILNQRQAEGQTLTKDQIDFLNGAADAQANLTKGQEDATVQAGILAEKYGENVDIGTQLANMTAQETASTDALTASINALITTLGGVPPEVTTKLTAEDDATETAGGILSTYGNIPDDVPTTVTAHDEATTTTDGIIGKYGDVPDDVPTSLTAIDNASGTIGGVSSMLTDLDGKTATTYIDTVYRQFESVIGHQHGGIVGAMQNGGVVRPEDIHFAAHGRMGGSPTWVGEAGPEMVNLPYGSTVWPAASSKMHSRDREDGSPHFENCSFTIVANNPRQFFDQMKSFQIGDNR